MRSIVNEEDTRLIKLSNDEYILYRIPIDELCGMCSETVSDIIDAEKEERKVLFEFYRTKEKKSPTIKQININRLMY